MLCVWVRAGEEDRVQPLDLFQDSGAIQESGAEVSNFQGLPSPASWNDEWWGIEECSLDHIAWRTLASQKRETIWKDTGSTRIKVHLFWRELGKMAGFLLPPSILCFGLEEEYGKQIIDGKVYVEKHKNK